MTPPFQVGILSLPSSVIFLHVHASDSDPDGETFAQCGEEAASIICPPLKDSTSAQAVPLSMCLLIRSLIFVSMRTPIKTYHNRIGYTATATFLGRLHCSCFGLAVTLFSTIYIFPDPYLIRALHVEVSSYTTYNPLSVFSLIK